MTSFATPFSFATASTTSSISLAIDFATGSGSRGFTLVFVFARDFFSAAMSRALLWLAAGDLADQIRLLHVAVLDRDVVAVLLEADVAALDRPARALEPAPPGDRHVALYLLFL